MSVRSQARGFTLVEVLVALAIVAIALMAGLQATSALTRNAARQTDVVLAHACAENELVKVRLSRQMPAIGDARVLCEQKGLHRLLGLSGRSSDEGEGRQNGRTQRRGSARTKGTVFHGNQCQQTTRAGFPASK